jgi:cysteinyl-tRNA synthetase
MIATRNQAKKQGDFAGADNIRDTLKSAGVVLQDARAGTSWRRQ